MNFMPSPYYNAAHPAHYYFDTRMHAYPYTYPCAYPCPFPCPSPPNMSPVPSFIHIEQPHYQQMQEHEQEHEHEQKQEYEQMQEQQQQEKNIIDNGNGNGNGIIGAHNFHNNTIDSISLDSSIDSVLSDISCADSVITENGQRIVDNLENILDDNDGDDGNNNDTCLSEAETKLYDDSIFFWRSMM